MVKNATPIPRFITGMSRGGTTWMTRLFNEHPDVAAFGETGFWGRLYIKPRVNDRYDSEQIEYLIKRFRNLNIVPSNTSEGSLKPATRQNLSQIVCDAFTQVADSVSQVEVFQRFCMAVARAEGKTCWIEKTPHHVNWIDRIVSAMPNAKIIVMIRPPYDFMLSYKHQGDRFEPRVRKLFHRMYHPLGCAIVWRGYMRSARNAQSQFPDHVMVTSIKMINDHPDEVMHEIQQFLELSPVKGMSNRVPPDNTSFHNEVKPVLNASDLFWMNLIAGREIRKADFQRCPASYRPLVILRSVLDLPIWAFYVVSLFFKRRGLAGLSYLWRWLK